MESSLELNKKIFLKKLAKISASFHQELDRYIENPNDENIHDIRVSIRRLDTAYCILPREVRKQEKIKEYVKQIKMLFKMNAKIRDFDIIRASMESRYPDKTTDLVSSLKNSRSEQLKNANKLALKVSSVQIPKISKSNIKKSKLKKRYLKILDETILNIQKNIIIVLEDEKKVDELHTLRKNFKKLRYSLELASSKKTTVDILNNLKHTQDMLGEIHDSDIIINYLRNTIQNPQYLEIIKAEILERSKKYNIFVTTLKKSKDISLDL